MMKIVKLVKYQLKVYFKGTGFVMPFIAMATFLYVMYSQKPLDVISGFLITGVFIFLIMAWVGMSTAQQEDEVMEQILIFKMNSAAAYYIGKLLFLVVIALIFALLCILFPVIQNQINSSNLFKRELIASDIISPLLFVSGSAICGAFLGNLFHPRVMKERRLAYVSLALICVLVIAKTAIIEEMPFLQYILCILPSIMKPTEIFADVECFNTLQSIQLFLLLILYASAFGGLKSIICHTKKF